MCAQEHGKALRILCETRGKERTFTAHYHLRELNALTGLTLASNTTLGWGSGVG